MEMACDFVEKWHQNKRSLNLTVLRTEAHLIVVVFLMVYNETSQIMNGED